ncbi:MAG TPA: FtsX-like permease family protein [Puia sp.]|nr:FtsX-like permease family protein [Puia sp.]
MLKNYFIIALRRLRRDKTHSFVNISSMAIGLAIVLLIAFWIFDECTYDRFNPHYDHVARIMQFETVNGTIGETTSLPFPLINELRTTYRSSFKHVVASWWNRHHTLADDSKKLPFDGRFMDPEGLDLLGFHLLRGQTTALQDPTSVVISAAVAKAFFGDTDPIGKTLHIDDKLTVAVTGVYADMPGNSLFKGVQFIAPLDLFLRSEAWTNDVRDSWGWDFCEIYVELADHADVAALSGRLRNSTLIHMRDNPLAASYHSQVFMQPMSRWHLYNEFKNGVQTGGAIQWVWLFGTIGFFVLLLACINFMNLSTARSEKRAREVGVRKAIGSKRFQLILQFYSESMVVAFLAFLLALVLAALALPWFNNIAGKSIAIVWTSPWLWGAGLTFSLLTGLLAGSYPALYLSSFRAVSVLKGSFKAGRWALAPRRALVVLQFSVSTLLVIGTIVVFRQIQYAKDLPANYDREHLLALPVTVPGFGQKKEPLRSELLQTGMVAEAATSSSPTTQIWEGYSGFTWPGKDPSKQADFGTVSVSYEYGSTIGWQIIRGRDYSRAFATDSAGLIVNAAAVSYMGLKDPIGTPVKWGDQTFHIIGVVKNLIIGSPYEEARPVAYLLNYDFNHNWYFVKLKPGVAVSDALPPVRKAFQQILPTAAFDYRLVDEQYNELFAAEQRVGTLAAFFAGFALLISALGIFGMASFTAEQRIREIGVRRVLGATVFGIWRLLTREFTLLVGLSVLIAGPLGWFALHRWLQNYTLHTNIAWWIFVVTGAGTLAITLLTVSWTAIRAATTNPVKALRSE